MPAPDDTPEGRFGAELRGLRERAGLTARRLAEELHRAHSGIVEYERGRRLPSVEVVEQYEEYFGLPRGTLVAQRERARVERLEQPRDGTLREHLGDEACPYKGLRAFEADDAKLFFGRERQVHEVLDGLAQMRFVAVVGASGSGKSSFVRAGLIAGIRSRGGDRVRVVLLTPGGNPLRELADAVDGQAGLAEELRADPDALARTLASREAQPVVIVVDQFEELFTLCDKEAERRCFVDALLGAWRDPSSPVSVIVALRADFYGRVASYPSFADAVVAHQALIGPMGPVDLRRAIELPAAESGLQLQPGLVDTMLEDLADEPGALPLLSHALLETWQRRRRLQLTVGGYREAGGVRGAIARTAEHTLQQMSDVDRAVARSIFLSLTDLDDGAEPTGRRIDRSRFGTNPGAGVWSDRVLDMLADARLVSVDEDTVVVAHEALIRYWPRLRGWIEADRAGLLVHRRLAQAAREWDALDREQAALYRGARLDAAREWLPDHADDVSRLEREFLSASEAALGRERTVRRRRVGLVVAALTTGLVAAIVAAVFANHQRAVAESRDLAARSASLLATDPGLALTVALEALRRSDTGSAQSALRQATLAQRATRVVAAHDGLAYGVAPSPDGRLAATAGGDRTVRVWNLATGQRVAEIGGYRDEVRAVSFSRDGTRIASATRNGEIAVTPATGGTAHVVARLKNDFASSIDFGPGGRLAIATDHGRVVVIRLRDGKLRELNPAPNEVLPLFSVAFDRTGSRVLTSGGSGLAVIWDTAGGPPVKLAHAKNQRGDDQYILSAAFSPRGGRVATTDEFGLVHVWDARTGDELTQIAVSDKQQASVRFSADEQRIVTAGFDGAIHVFEARDKAALAEYIGHHGPARATFVPGGDTIVSAGEEDGTLRTWQAPTAKVPPRPGIKPRFSMDGRLIVSLDEDGPVYVWNPATGRDRKLSDLQTTNAVRFSPDAKQVVGVSDDGPVMLWDVASGRSQAVPALDDRKLDVAIAPATGRIAIGGSKHLVIQAPDGSDRIVLRGHLGRVNAVAFSPDGRHLLSGSDDATARIWNAGTGQPERTLNAKQGVVRGVSWSRDGQRVATAGADGTVAVWPASGDEPAAVLAGHTLAVNTAEFNGRGDRIVTASDDGTVRVWNPTGGLALVVIDRHAGVAGGADFSRDGRYVVSAGDEGMRLVPCEVCGSDADVLRLARSRPPRPLTDLERRRLLPGG